MIKTIIRAMYSAFISIVLFSIFLAGWTGYAFISQPTNSDEIINVIQDMYCLLYTSPSPRDRTRSRMPSSA